MRPHKLRAVLLAALLALAALVGASGSVLAYGHADQPLAQIEFSANCNNPLFFLCSPQTGFGLGGVWVWIEIDADHTADVAGAGCGHVRGVGGSADSIRGEVTWTWSQTPQGFPAAFSAPPDPKGYYNVQIGPTVLAFPVSVGHYSWHPMPGVALEVQVAP